MAQNEENLTTNDTPDYNELFNIAYHNFPKSYGHEWEGVKVNILDHLSIDNMISFVKYVVDNCFDNDTGEYRPEIRDFAIRNRVVEKYTDLKLPEDLTEMYEVLYGTDLYDFILSVIDIYQFEAIEDAIDQKIEDKLSLNHNELEKKLDKTMAGLEKIEEGLSTFFDGMDSDAMAEFSKALTSEDFLKTLIQALANNVGSEEPEKGDE